MEVRIAEQPANKPQEHVEEFKANGITVIHKCTSVRHALSAERWELTRSRLTVSNALAIPVRTIYPLGSDTGCR